MLTGKFSATPQGANTWTSEKTVGIVPIVAGALTLAYGGFGYTDEARDLE